MASFIFSYQMAMGHCTSILLFLLVFSNSHFMDQIPDSGPASQLLVYIFITSAQLLVVSI